MAFLRQGRPARGRTLGPPGNLHVPRKSRAAERAREAWPAAISGREYSIATRSRYKKCFDRLAGAGHLVPIEAPEEFQARLLEKLLPLAETW